MSMRSLATLSKVAAVLMCTAGLAFSADVPGMNAGKVQLKSAGAMAFTPNGVLLVGDSTGGSIVALDVKDEAPARSGGSVEIKGINEKIAAMVGTTPDQILIQDVTVNPVSKHVYVSVSRGRGADAVPLIFWTDASGKLTEVPLDNVAHSAVNLPDPPTGNTPNAFGQSQRMLTITSMAYVDGNVIVAGLSNEEFSSTLHTIPFPFRQADKGTGIKIYHSSHAQYETESPIRTFVPYQVNNRSYILAAYTCSPIVEIPVSDLKPGSKVTGTTVGNLGEGNRPLDMISYTKGGHSYFLVANSSLGVIKVSVDHLDSNKAITSPSEGPAGFPMETIKSLQGVQHLSKLDDTSALVLVASGNTTDLHTIALP
jgi:hypothetical protein